MRVACASCFTLTSRRRNLDIEEDSTESRAVWLDFIQRVFESAGMSVEPAPVAGAAATAADGKRADPGSRRLSVVVRRDCVEVF